MFLRVGVPSWTGISESAVTDNEPIALTHRTINIEKGDEHQWQLGWRIRSDPFGLSHSAAVCARFSWLPFEGGYILENWEQDVDEA